MAVFANAGGGKSTLAILLKRALEEYSRTDDGALYAIKGSPMHESPLNLVPTSMRGAFRETYGVEISGELSPWARDRLEREYQGDYLSVPVERVFLSEAMRVGVPMQEAFERMMTRMPLAEVRFFAIVVSIQQQAGGNLSEVLNNLSGVLRDRKRLQAKVRALSADVIGAPRTEALIKLCRGLWGEADAGAAARAAAQA